MSKISPVTGHYVDVEVDGLRVQGLLPRERHRTAAGLPAHRRLPQPPVARPARGRGDHPELPGHRLRPAAPRQVRPAREHRVVDGGVPATADHYANFIVAFCDALELENPIFMGSSFGGNVALQLALRRPDRFAGVIPVEGADYSPGLLPRLVAAPARQRRAGVRQRRLGSDGPAVARGRPLEDLVLLHARARRRSRAICTSTRSITTCAASSARSTATDARW